jgi:hypothetical protein
VRQSPLGTSATNWPIDCSDTYRSGGSVACLLAGTETLCYRKRDKLFWRVWSYAFSAGNPSSNNYIVHIHKWMYVVLWNWLVLPHVHKCAELTRLSVSSSCSCFLFFCHGHLWYTYHVDIWQKNFKPRLKLTVAKEFCFIWVNICWWYISA